MGVRVAIKRSGPPWTHAYPTFTITLYPFVCEIVEGEITLCDHRDIAWLSPADLSSLDWAEADLPVIEAYRKSITRTLL